MKFIMTTSSHSHHLGRFIFATALIGLALLLTFRSDAQTQKSDATNKKQSGTTTHGEPHAGSRHEQMDRVSRAQLEKAQQELEKAQKHLMEKDWTKVEAEMVKAKAAVEKALRSVEFDFAKAEIEKAMAEMKKSLTAQEGKFAQEMKKAEAEMKRAQAELELMQEGMELMEKDGLIKPGESINIDWDDDILIINGQRQNREISDRYKKYFKQHKNRNKRSIEI
jgi:hypothetical protein